MSTRSLIGARRAFVDTSAFVALTDPRDGAHARASVISQHLQTERWRLFTTNFILAEAHGLLVGRAGRDSALRFLQSVDRSRMTVIRATAFDERRGRGILTRYADKDFSLTDAISFAVMQRLRIREAFAFDRHFAQFGLALLAP